MRLRVINQKRFAVVVAVAVTLITVLCFCSYAHSGTSYDVCEFTVSEGDSLWEIAEVYTDDSVDIREYIREIKELNGMETAELMPGDVIIIPIYEK